MTLLETVVLLNVVQVVTTDDNGAVHLGRDDHSSHDSTTDRNTASEGALLIDVSTFDGLLGSLEAKTYVLVPPHGLLGDLLAEDALSSKEHCLLLLESLLCLLHYSIAAQSILYRSSHIAV